MNLSLNRIILFVQNVEVLKYFYQENFQLEFIEEIREEWVVLKAGGCELALHKAGAGFAKSAPGTNNTKLVFETTDLSALRATLVHNHISMKEIKSFPNLSYLFCDGEDTEGNVFQLMQKI